MRPLAALLTAAALAVTSGCGDEDAAEPAPPTKPRPGTAAEVEPILERTERETSFPAGSRRVHPSIIAFQLIDDVEGYTVNYVKSKGIDIGATFARKADCSRPTNSMRCRLEVYGPGRRWQCRSQAAIEITEESESTATRGPWSCRDRPR